jgi:hypothetical protein
MNETKPRTAEGKVLWHFTMSLDGFVVGPNHAMDWMAGTNRPGLEDAYVTTTVAVLGVGPVGTSSPRVGGRPCGGDGKGPIFVLTHHPEDATPADGVTFLDYDPAEAVRLERLGRRLQTTSGGAPC